METIRVRHDRSILSDLIFYISLSLVLASKGNPEELCTRSLKSYIKDCEDAGIFKDPEITASYMQKAYEKLPSQTLNILNVDTLLVDNIRTIDVNFSWIAKL